MVALLVALIFLDDRVGSLTFNLPLTHPSLPRSLQLPPGFLMMSVFAVLICLGTRELRAMFQAKGIQTHFLVLSLASITACSLSYLVPDNLGSARSVAATATLIVIYLLAALILHTRRGRTEGAVAAAGVTMLTMIYFGFMPGFFMAIRRTHGAWVVAAIMLIAKSGDIGAYFTGRAIGKHKLIPWLSPGKTWEGLIGGVALAAIVATALAAVANRYYQPSPLLTAGLSDLPPPLTPHYPLGFASIAGVLIGLVGHLGDLMASLFKRDADFKDSGRSIPGFGGLLDVVDSPIAVAPLAYWLLTCLE